MEVPVVVHEEQLAVRTWRSQVDRAQRLAAKMQELPRFELLGVTKMTAVRLALADGLEVIEAADRKYFRKDEAEKLMDAIDEGLNVGGIQLPVINNFNVMLTPTPYSSRLLAQGIVDLHSRRFGGGKQVLLNIRLPKVVKQRLDAAVAAILAGGPPPEMESASAALRLILQIGLFWMEHKVYWESKAQRSGRGTRAGR